MNNVSYSPAKAREIENARLTTVDADLRRYATLTLEAYLAERAVDPTVIFLEADRDLWVAGHAGLVSRIAELPAGDADHAHTFGLRKITPRMARRDGEARRGVWLVAPCSCGRVAA